jgi:hypothetical protein
MDDQLRHILQHLYGENPPVPVEDLLRDDDLRAEFESLREVKQTLDQRPPKRPPAEVVDQVVAASASSHSSNVRTRRDRPPKQRAFFRRRPVQALAVTLVVLLGLGAFFVLIDGGGTVRPGNALLAPPNSPVMSDRSPRGAAEEAAPSGAASSPPMASGRSAIAAADTAAPEDAEAEPESPFKARVGLAASQDAPDAPTWDESDAVQRLHRRIELLEARSPETAWDDPAVMSLDVLPGATAPSRLDRGLNTVRERRTSSGGQ